MRVRTGNVCRDFVCLGFGDRADGGFLLQNSSGEPVMHSVQDYDKGGIERLPPLPKEISDLKHPLYRSSNLHTSSSR